LQISPINLNKRLSNNEKKIQKIYDAVFEVPLISLPQINIGGNIENNIVIENGYLSTYYQNTTKNIQNIIIKGTANPYINNYPLYGFSNTKPIVGTTLENVAVAKKKGEVVEHKTIINPNQYIYINGNENKLKIYEVKDEIDKEVSSLNNDQQAILAKDEVYNKLSGELQMLIQEELINSVKDKVANSPRGKELLEKQLNNIRTKKDSIIEEANRGLELFKKFQIAAQANPKLTYVEFCKTINNE
jgi:hypothetical protein